MKKKFISLLVAAEMLISCMGVMGVVSAADATIADKMSACSDGAELLAAIKALNAEELEALGINLTNLNKAEYPQYISDALLADKALWTSDEAFAQSYQKVVEAYIPTVIYTTNDETKTGNYWRAFTTYSLDQLKALGNTFYGDKQLRIFTRVIWGTNAKLPTHGFEAYVPYTIDRNDYIVDGSITTKLDGWDVSKNQNITIALDGYTENAVPADVLAVKENKTYVGTEDVQDAENDAIYNTYKTYSDSFTPVSGITTEWEYAVDPDGIVTKAYTLTDSDIETLFRGNGKENMVFKITANNSTSNVATSLYLPYETTISLTYDYTIKEHVEEEQQQNLREEIWKKINTTDELALLRAIDNLTAEEIAVLKIDMTIYNKLAYPKFAVRKIIENGYSDLAGFQTAFENAIASVTEAETVTMEYFDEKETFMLSWGYAAQDMPNADNPYKGRKGLAPNWEGVNGSWRFLEGEGTYLYLVFKEAVNKNAIIDGQISLNVQDQKNMHTIYINRFSFAPIPNYSQASYFPNVDQANNKPDAVELDNQVMAAWESYADGMTVDENPVTIVYTGITESTASRTVTADLSPAMLNAIKLNDGNLTIQVDAEDTDTFTVVKMSDATLTLIVDKTIAMQGDVDEYAQLISALNAITSDTTDDAVTNFAKKYLLDIATDALAAEKFDNLANSVRIQIIKDLAAEKLGDIEDIRAVFNQLTAAAVDVLYKYEVVSMDFANWHDAKGHDVDGDGQEDEYIGWMSKVGVKKLSNYHGDFALVAVAYKDHKLVCIDLVDSRSLGGKKASYDSVKAAAEGETVDIVLSSFFSVPEPDAVRVFILDGFNNLKAFAKTADVLDTKVQGQIN